MESSFTDNVDNSLWVGIILFAGPHSETPSSQRYGECVPQTAYKRGNGTSPSANVKQGLVLFLLEDGSLLPVCTALRKEYTGLPNRDETALPDVGQTVTVRFEWPGYEPKDYLLRVIDWCNPPKRIPVSKLATEIAKLVRKFIKEMQGVPIDPIYARWQVGPGGIEIADLHLASFEQVTLGSWQIRLFYKR